jgi:phosphopantothenoylcysteine decarboxylase/phosphopantothenate--cysteine ligase
MAKEKNILLGVTASISAYKACDIITDLRKLGHEVTGREVISDFFSVEGRVKPIHIELAKKSDLILIAPASADIIAKISHGMADDVLTCTVLASTAPIVIAPAMNEKMLANSFTQENLKRVKERGMKIVDPIHGHLVCSDQGMGHLAENTSIIKAVTDAF